MSANFSAEPHTSLEDELSVNGSFLRPLFVGVGGLIARIKWGKECLDNMIAVHVGCKLENIGCKLSNQHEYFLTKIIDLDTQYLNKDLDCSSAVNAHRYFNNLMQNRVHYYF